MAPHSDPVATATKLRLYADQVRGGVVLSTQNLAEFLRVAADEIDALVARLEQAEAWIKAAMETGDSGLVAALKQAEAELEEDTQVIQQQQKAVEALEAALKNMEAERDLMRAERDAYCARLDEIEAGRAAARSALVVVDPSDPSLAVPHFEDAECPACYGKGLEGQMAGPGLLLDTARGTDECRMCGGSGRVAPPQEESE